MSDNSEYLRLIDSLQCNIIEWYPFETGKRILNLTGNEKIQNYLESKGYDTNLSTHEKYDYILFVGNFSENLRIINNNLKYLKDDGKLLIAFDNYLSIRNFCTENENVDYSRDKIEDYLKNNEFFYQKFYYVFPDIKTTNVIFTDDYMINNENISRNISFYKNDEEVVKSENSLINKLLKNDKSLMKKFANAFFIECSQKEFQDNKIKFVSYSNMRKNEYKIKTIIKDNFAYKMAFNKEGNDHIENIKKNIDIMNSIGLKTIDKYEKDYILSEFQIEDTLDKIIMKQLMNNQKDEAKKLIKRYYKTLLEKLPNKNEEINIFEKYQISYDIQDIENLHFTKYGLWDLIFQNAFLINDDFYFFDQEWLENNMPIEYIMYRSFLYCTYIKKYINFDELYNLVNINDKNIELFKKLDEKLQNKTRDELAWNVHSSNRAGLSKEECENTILNLEKDKQIMTEEFKKLLNEKDARIKFLEDNIENDCKVIREKELEINNKTLEINNLNDKLNLVVNSKSWKLTKPLRKIEGMRRKGAKENED